MRLADRSESRAYAIVRMSEAVSGTARSAIVDVGAEVADHREGDGSVGFLNSLIGRAGGGSEPPCPSCGATLDGEELIEGRYWCDGCGLVITDGGELVNVKPGDPRILRTGRSGDEGVWDHCPHCGASLAGFGCLSCDVEFVYEGGRLVERGLSSRGERPERRCVSCDTPMKHGGEFTAAWEDGDNANAYVTCPSCGYQDPF
jgi:DNA-directed RNA polymerase subunit RPC12/RpoP/ribosomal protein L37AE/L43A